MTEETVFTDSDKQFRHLWLACLIMSFLYGLGNALLTIQKESLEDVITLLCGILLGFVLTYLLYHYAYKKSGTRFLTYSIVCSYIVIIHDIFNYSKGTPFHIEDLVGIIAAIIWIVLSKIMRRINDRINTAAKKRNINTAVAIDSI
jgi:drug/metabolite transporter (DMT)-like permease